MKPLYFTLTLQPLHWECSEWTPAVCNPSCKSARKESTLGRGLKKNLSKKNTVAQSSNFCHFSNYFLFFHFSMYFLNFYGFFVISKMRVSHRAPNFFTLSISLGIPVTDLLYFWSFLHNAHASSRLVRVVHGRWHQRPA